MTKTNLKLILPSIIIALIFAFVLAYIISQAINNYLMQSFYDTLNNAVYANLEYELNGTVVLEDTLANESFNIYCDAVSGGSRSADIDSIEACQPQQLFIELPANSVFSIATPHNLSSISVWDNDNTLVQSIPGSASSQLNAIKEKQELSLNWKFDSAVINIANTDIYRGKFQYSFFQPENEDLLFTVPIFNGAKTDTLGYIAVYIKAPQTGTWDVVSYLLPSILPLAILISLFGAVLFSRNLKQQVAELQMVTSAWAIGDFRPKADTQSNDEIGRLGADLNQMADQLEDLLETKATVASLETKQELARDLHDAAKQQLFAASMQLNAVKKLINENPESAKKHLDHATELTKMAQQELAAVIGQLGPVQMQNQSFDRAVSNLVKDFSDQQSIPVDLDFPSRFKTSPEIEKTLFRILQESLSNIAKHSQATQASVRLTTTDDQIELNIKDNGTGFNTQQHTVGYGLQSMQERAQQLGGHLTIESKTDEETGTLVSAQIKHSGA